MRKKSSLLKKKPAPSKSFMINTENTCVSYTAINYKDSWVFWSIHLMHLMLEKLREEGRKCGVYSFFNATEPWVHWSLDNTKQAWQSDPNKLFILGILKYLHGLPCLVKKGQVFIPGSRHLPSEQHGAQVSHGLVALGLETIQRHGWRRWLH